MARAVKGHGFDRLTPLAEARAKFLRLVPRGPLRREAVALSTAWGRVLAAPVRAAEDVPAFDRAAMDGFAVRARDTFGALQTNPLPLRLVDSANVRISEGQCARIATGGILPPGADAVVMLEHTRELGAGRLEIEATATPWDNVSRQGEDVRRGAPILSAGVRLEFQDLAMMAAFGLRRAVVAVRPAVSVLATGDEIVDASRPRGRGKTFDANRPGALAAVAEAGARPIDLGIVRDDRSAIRAKLSRALRRSDLVVVSGGTSVGAKDFLPEVLGDLGRPGVVVHGVAIRPGYPVALGAARGTPVVLLPGSPVAALLNVEEFALPAVRKMLGQPEAHLPRGALVQARAKRRIPGAAGLQTYARVVISGRPGALVADPLRISGSGILSSLVLGTGIVVVPPQKEGIEEGELVEVRLLRPLAAAGIER